MRPRWLLLVIAAALLALVTLTFIHPNLMVSPGTLAAGHAGIATDCFACHSPWRGADSRRCAQCHAVADIGLRTTKGLPVARRGAKVLFHQELVEQDCMACHSDHLGAKLAQASRKPFSHTLLRATIRRQCESCHAAPTDGIHRDLRVTCTQCHETNHWKPAAFDHAKLFVLDRDHNTECVTCHTNNDFRRFTCYGCHEHRPDRVRAEHLEEGIKDFENCVKCHRSASEEPEGRESHAGRERD